MGKKVNPQPKNDGNDLLRTKLALPRLRASAVSRAGLLERLDAGLDRRLTLISAPAGFGKTTLVSEWALRLNGRSDQPSVAWFALDASDNDPARFWRYVIAACQSFDASIGQSALDQLYVPRPPAFETLLTTFINDLTRLTERHVLVLEDYHLITAQRIHDTLAFVLDHLPATLHVVMMTRSDPPLPLARLRTRDELNELHAGDLRFSPTEAQAFLQQSIAVSLSRDALQQLEAHTEGWVAGLQIAALALQGRQDAGAVEQFLTGFNGGNRHILDYLGAEVLEGQPDDIQQFLLETSFLSRLTGDLCDTVTGGTDSAALLDRLERANLFLTPLDDSQQWYRYHALFAEAMQHYAQRRLRATQLQFLYQRAADWYEAHHLLDEAVEICLAAQDFERTAGLIEHIFLSQRFTYQLYTLQRWVERLPETLLPAHPLICLLEATSILFGSDRYAPATKVRMEKPLKIAEESWRAEGSQWGLGAVLALRSMASFWQGDITAMTINAGQSLELLPENDPFWRSLSLGNMAMGELMAGDAPAALDAAQQSLRLFEAVENPYGARAMLFITGDIHFCQGDLHQAAQFYRRVLTEAKDDVSDLGSALSRLALLSYEWNDLETAEVDARQSLEIADRINDGPMKLRASLVMAQIYAARSQFGRAQQTLNALTPTAHWLYLRRELLTMQARIALQAGDMVTAQRWCTASAETSAEATHSQREQEGLVVARILIRQRNYDDALRLLDQWQADAQAMGRTGSEVESVMLKALAYAAQGETRAAKKLLVEALRLAQVSGYQRLFLNEGETMAALLKATLPDLSDALLTYARSLLYAFTRKSEANMSSEAVMLPLSVQEQRVLHLLAAGLSYPQMADELVVSVNTIKTQVKSIYRKLNVDNRDEARDLAQHLKLI